MTLDQWSDNCLRAIKANFASRNQVIYADRDFHLRQSRSRRISVRRWVAKLRLARDPATSQDVARAVRFRVD